MPPAFRLLSCVFTLVSLWLPLRHAAANEAPEPFSDPVGLADAPDESYSALRQNGGEYLAGAVAGAITVPPMLLLGKKLGSLSSNWVTATLPPILLMAAVPPVAVAGAEWLVGRKLAPGTRFHPAVWGAVGVNVLIMVVGSLTGAWAGDGLSLGLFTLGEALLMPAAVTVIMRVTRRPPRHVSSRTFARSAPATPPALLAGPGNQDPPLSPGPHTFSVPVAGFSF